MKNEKGITLIVLVITIIIIMILASIAIYSGAGTIRYAKYNKAKSEIQVIQSYVNQWYKECQEAEDKVAFFSDYGEETNNCNQEELVNTFVGAKVSDDEKEKYRFFSEKFLKEKLGLDISFDYLISIEDRNTILYNGVLYNKKIYYTLDDFGLQNIKEISLNTIVFKLEQGDNTDIVISNLKLDYGNDNNSDISKFIVEYSKKGENSWTDITKDVVKLEDGENGNKITKYKFSVDEFGEYDVRVRTVDKKNMKIGQVEIYEKKLTEEAPGIYISTLDYTASSEFDDSKILPIDGAMLLSAGSQAVPSRVENDKFVWRSSNTNVATVTTDGVVKCGTEAGTAIITLIGSNKTKSICKVKTTAKIANEKQDSNYTINGEEGSHLNPTIPGGFYAIDTNITETTANNIDWKLTGNQTNTGKGLVIMNDDGDQFVWVPVKKDEVILDSTREFPEKDTAVTVTSDLYTPMATTYNYNGNTYYRGMLYSFEGITTTKVKYNSVYDVGTTYYREPSLVTGKDTELFAPVTSTTGSSYDAKYFTNAGFSETQGVIGFGTKMQEDYDEMIRQVQAYGGFWVGRYESSWNYKAKKVASIAGAKSFKADDQNDRDEINLWYGLYRTHKAYSRNSSMIWGSQYDAMMNWMAKNGITVGHSTEMRGIKRNAGKNATDGDRITGNPKYNDKLSNVIDIYGNSFEWTLEAKGVGSRTSRGGRNVSAWEPGSRIDYNTDNMNGYHASRLSLYIK